MFPIRNQGVDNIVEHSDRHDAFLAPGRLIDGTHDTMGITAEYRFDGYSLGDKKLSVLCFQVLACKIRVHSQNVRISHSIQGMRCRCESLVISFLATAS